jgi:CBS domain-containing protein
VYEKGLITGRRIGLRKKNNSIVELKLSLFIANNLESEQTVCDGILEPFQTATMHEEVSVFSQKLYELLVKGHQKVGEICVPGADCPHDATLLQAADIMKRYDKDAVLITVNQTPSGIITFNDVITRFVAKGMPATSVASDYMSAPLVDLDENESLNRAAALMDKEGISHLVIRSSDGEVKGLISKRMLAGTCVNPSEVLRSAIEIASNTASLGMLRRQMALQTKPILSSTANVQVVGKIISAFNDAITSHIIDTAISEIGKPPVPFAFMVIGSAGREELAFNSDQDNAIIFKETNDIPTEELQQYFLNLSVRVCKRLDESGLHKCPGNYMASNPKWCQPLRVWKNYFTEWIVNAEPENILNISVFFDLRHAYGEPALFNKLEDHVFEAMKGRSAFFYFLAQSVSSFKPPLNVFGNIVTESTGKNTEIIDVKTCIAAVVMFARIYALHHGIRCKDTSGRVQSLRAATVLNPATADEVIFHYNFLMYQRMIRQLNQIRDNAEITNAIVPRKMSEMDQMILKKVFSQMSGYQEKLAAEFMSAFKG